MPRKSLTKEKFLEKAILKHGLDKYDYSLVNFIDNRTPVTIICNKHKKEFFQKPFIHLMGSGCKQCGIDSMAKKSSISKEEFILRSSEIHNNKYNYDNIEFKNMSSTVELVCPVHNTKFKQSCRSHIRGAGCKKCATDIKRMSSEIFFNECNKTHNYKYDYSKSIYTSALEKIEITCPIHNESFFQQAYDHKNGAECPKCGIEKCSKSIRSNTEEFIKKAQEIHGKNKYDYTQVKYDKNYLNVKIRCIIHDHEFEQTPQNHLAGKGCILCAREKIQEYNKENPTGWTYTNWEKSASVSKQFDSFKIYFIQLYNENEEFFKIGKTYKTVIQRLYHIPYQYKIIKEIILENAKETCELEHTLKSQFKGHKYLPEISFNGMYECFNISAKDEILEYINNLTDEINK